MTADMQLGMIGLGQMGSNLAKQALDRDIEVVGADLQDHPELEEKEIGRASCRERVSSPV